MLLVSTTLLDEIREMFDEWGLVDYGEAGFGTEIVDALKAIGAKNGDIITIYQYWDEEAGAGLINDRVFYEDTNNNEVRFTFEKIF